MLADGGERDRRPDVACALSPKIEPKRTRTPAVPLPALLLVVKIERKRTPSPSVQAKNGADHDVVGAGAVAEGAEDDAAERWSRRRGPARMSSPSDGGARARR